MSLALSIALMRFVLLLLVSVPILRGMMLVPAARNSGEDRRSGGRGHRIGLLILLRMIKQLVQNLRLLQLGQNWVAPNGAWGGWNGGIKSYLA